MDKFYRGLSNKSLLREVHHIKNKDASSYNWGREAKKNFLQELERRKKEGTIKKSAGKKRNSGSYGFNFSIPKFRF